MSHSTSSAIASTTQPLSDILPWGAPIIVASASGNDNSNNNNDTSASADTRTLLITDAVSTDGRFLLHTLALQFLSSRYSYPSSSIGSSESESNSNSSTNTMEGAVLWISSAPVAEKQIMMGLRKGLQHNLGASSGGGGGNNAPSGPASSWMVGKNKTSGGGGIGNSSGRIHIVSIPLELADAALMSQENDDDNFSHEAYLKSLHKRIVHWLNHRELLSMQHNQSRQKQQSTQEGQGSTLGPNLIIIDNATSLGTLFGDKLAGMFLSSVRSSLRKYTMKKYSSIQTKKSNATAATSSAKNIPTRACSVTVTTTNLLAIRASSPDDGGLYQIDGNDSILQGEKIRAEYARLLRPWIGFGSGIMSSNNNDGAAGTDILQMEEQSNYLSLSPGDSAPSLLHRSGLYEIADGIVDVSPLESGYARDVLGRLSFATTWSGKGWWGIGGVSGGGTSSAGIMGVGASGSRSSGGGNAALKQDEIHGAYSSICVNYRCDDSGVRVMRLRSR